MSSEGELVNISIESLEKLRDLYENNWPQHINAFCYIDSMITRFKNFPETREINKIYTINGKVEGDATFVSIMRDRDIIFDTLDPTLERLKVALSSIDYSKNRNFMNVKNDYRDFLQNFIETHNMDMKKIFDDVTVMMHISKENAKKFEIVIPEGTSLRTLSENDAAKINSIWPHASHDSEKFIAYCIKYNPSVGLYSQDNQLLSWCLYHDFGLLLALQTDPNHLRKGFAEIVTKAIAKKIAEDLNFDCAASIIKDNFKSINLFKKIGFNQIDTNSWVGVTTEK